MTALAALEAWLQALAGANPLEVAVSAAGRDAARRIERAQVQASARADETRATIAGLEREIEELESGVDPTPPAPYTRGAGSREQPAGAPLWQLVDFRDDVAPDDRAGIEAALEAAGILDGWVTSSGELLDPDTEDVLLVAGVDPAHPQTGSRLVDTLVPAIGGAAGVSEADVRGLLATIGLGESDAPVWVSGAGRFCNGVLRGAWHKPAAAYIGRAAREAARHARLAELHRRATAARMTRSAASLGTSRARASGRLSSARSRMRCRLWRMPRPSRRAASQSHSVARRVMSSSHGSTARSSSHHAASAGST